MKIGTTRFWIDRDSRSIGIRSANYSTDSHPFEFYLNRRIRWLPDFNIYEDTDDTTELRLSFRWLWFSLNMLLCELRAKPGQSRLDGSDPRWGWYFIDNCLVLCWRKLKHIDLPFVGLIHLRSELMSIDRQRVVANTRKFPSDHAGFVARCELEEKHSATFDYKYELLNGETQNVKATIRVERMVHRRKWTPFKRVRDSIWVTFSDEVGPERGSWKGGTTGCGYTLKRGETAIQCLRRMERERRFER